MATLHDTRAPESGTYPQTSTEETVGLTETSHQGDEDEADISTMLQKLTHRELVFFKELFEKTINDGLTSGDAVAMCEAARTLADESCMDFVDCFYGLYPGFLEQGGEL